MALIFLASRPEDRDSSVGEEKRTTWVKGLWLWYHMGCNWSEGQACAEAYAEAKAEKCPCYL